MGLLVLFDNFDVDIYIDSDMTVFVMLPEPVGLPPGAEYRYSTKLGIIIMYYTWYLSMSFHLDLDPDS